MKEELYIRRNIPECMGMAWTLMSTNIKRMAKALWLPAVVLALLIAVVSTLNGISQTEAVVSNDISWGYLISLFVGTLLVVLAVVFLDAKIFKLLNLQPLGFCIERATKAFGVNLLLALIGILLVSAVLIVNTLLASTGKLSPSIALVLGIVEAVVVLILMLLFFSPMIFALTKYMIEPETKMKMLWKNYRIGLKNVGFIIAFFLLCFVVLVIAYIIIALPNVITSVALNFSLQGMSMGDPSGLPSHFFVLFAITAFVTAFVNVILRIWSLFATYYMYASIEAKNGKKDVGEEAPTRFERV